jgi:two-component system nitrate/nitrite response regulator NarL
MIDGMEEREQQERAAGTGPPQGSGRARPATVVVADDHPIYRDGLARAIGSRPDLRLVGEAANGVEAARLIAARHPDVAVLDLRMPGLDGIAVCAQVTARRPEWRTRVVLLTAYLERALVSEAIGAGAAGYVGKDVSRYEICEAVARVSRGGTAFSDLTAPGIIQALERSLRDDGAEDEPAPGRTSP